MITYYLTVYFLVAVSLPISTLIIIRFYGCKFGYMTWIVVTGTCTVLFPIVLPSFILSYRGYVTAILNAIASESK